MLTLYSMPSSGNSYKVRLLLAHLGLPFRHLATEWNDGNELTATDAFRQKNPLGKVPMLELEDGRVLTESNAILFYLAEGTDYIPHDKWARAQMLRWMFFEQYSHEPNVAVRIGITHTYPHKFHLATPDTLQATLEGGNKALDAMEQHLQSAPFMAGESYSIADIALYAYTHKADKGGFDLASRPNVSNWLNFVRNQSGHVALEWVGNKPNA